MKKHETAYTKKNSCRMVFRLKFVTYLSKIKMASGNFVAIKCVVVGDHAIGKSSLIKTYIDGVFPESVESAVCDSFHCDIPIESTTYKIEIVDVPDEREEFNDIR